MFDPLQPVGRSLDIDCLPLWLPGLGGSCTLGWGPPMGLQLGVSRGAEGGCYRLSVDGGGGVAVAGTGLCVMAVHVGESQK